MGQIYAEKRSRYIENHTNAPRIDLPELLARLDNDRDLLHELFAIFKEEFPRQVYALRGAVACQDLRRVGNVSHTLNGNACKPGD
jgi:HPt (histidine-containing phosphotransfer) domain-containing protein